MISLQRRVLGAIHTSTGWQFLDGGVVAEQGSAILGLGEMGEIDPTLVELACLPIGFSASCELRSMNTA